MAKSITCKNELSPKTILEQVKDERAADETKMK
jgi:hypothetical protein